MHKAISIIIILLLLFCKSENQSKDNSNSILQNFGLMFQRNNRVTISGTAVKGIVKNAKVTINSIAKDGSCDASNILATGNTDSEGSYSLVYNKTGNMVCLIVSSQAGERTTVYDEKLKADVSVPSDSDFKLVTLLPESRVIQNVRKNTQASPFSSMLQKRFQYLVKESGATPDTNQLYKKASREVVIRFGLNAGLSTIKSTRLSISPSISDNDYPELDDLPIDFTMATDPNAAKFISIMAGFSQLANQYKSGTEVSARDINSVINSFATDFEDGVFDGKGIDNKPITIGTGTNQATLPSTPLTTVLLPAIASYLQEGGKLSVGISGTSSATVTASQVTNLVQFVDNAPITSATSAGLSYARSSYWFTQNIAVTPITPKEGGTFTSCSASPSLPAGLSLNSATCVISGTPTTWQAVASYTILASNSSGNFTTTISISIGLNYSASSYSFPQNVAITPITPTGGGTFTGCSINPSLPTGLSLNNTTCVISGTPTTWQATAGYTISASNSSGNATTTISISVSSDGTSWTARTLPSSNAWKSVTYGNGVFVAVAQSTTSAASSTDGINWTARTLPSPIPWNSVTYGNGVFVAVGDGPTTIAASSTDGINWTARTIPSGDWISVTYGNGVFFAATNTSNVTATSTDGINWTARTFSSGSTLSSVTYGNGVFVAVSDGPSTVAGSSVDGINWTTRTLPSSSNWSSVVYGNGIFFAVAWGPTTAAASSTDGINWTSRTLPSSLNWRSVTYGNGIFVAVAGSTTTAASSVNGINWTTRTLPSGPNWQSVAYGNGIFVTIATASTIAASSP